MVDRFSYRSGSKLNSRGIMTIFLPSHNYYVLLFLNKAGHDCCSCSLFNRSIFIRLPGKRLTLGYCISGFLQRFL
jgi:hypothetical protein